MVRMVILWLMVLVMTNTGCLPGSANGGGKGNVSHFKPFSEFLDRYIIDQEISQYVSAEWLLWDRTPFARIVSIFDRDTGENLCAKVIYKRFCSPTGLLVLDPQVLTSIRHKNIIKYYDIYESEEEIIVTIERYGGRGHTLNRRAFGGELLERIIEKVHYTEMDASHIIKQVLEAVAYLHSKSIVGLTSLVQCRFTVTSSRKTFFFQSLAMYSFLLSVSHHRRTPTSSSVILG